MAQNELSMEDMMKKLGNEVDIKDADVMDDIAALEKEVAMEMGVDEIKYEDDIMDLGPPPELVRLPSYEEACAMESSDNVENIKVTEEDMQNSEIYLMELQNDNEDTTQKIEDLEGQIKKYKKLAIQFRSTDQAKALDYLRKMKDAKKGLEKLKASIEDSSASDSIHTSKNFKVKSQSDQNYTQKSNALKETKNTIMNHDDRLHEIYNKSPKGLAAEDFKSIMQRCFDLRKAGKDEEALVLYRKLKRMKNDKKQSQQAMQINETTTEDETIRDMSIDDVTEEDMNNPEYNDMLASIEQDIDVQNSNGRKDIDDDSNKGVFDAENKKDDHNSNSTDVEVSASMDAEENINVFKRKIKLENLRREIEELTAKCVKLKNAGRTDDALVFFRALKARQKELENLENHVEAVQYSEDDSSDQSLKPVTLKKTLSMTDRFNMIKKRFNEYKEAALRYQAVGNEKIYKILCQDMVVLRSSADLIQKGLGLSVGKIPVSLHEREAQIMEEMNNSHSVSSEREVKAKEIKEKAEKEKRRVRIFHVLNKQLLKEISETDNPTVKKKLSKDLKQLREKLKIPGQPAPVFHMEDYIKEVSQKNKDVTPNVIEFTIVGGKSPSQKKMNAFVKFDMGFPTPQMNVGTTVESKIKKAGGEWVWNHTQNFPVIRKRAKRLERKKISLEIWENPGLFRSARVIGYATVPLAGVLSKCTQVIRCNIRRDIKRKAQEIGGSIVVRLRVHEPFINKEVVTVPCKRLVIDKYPSLELFEKSPESKSDTQFSASMVHKKEQTIKKIIITENSQISMPKNDTKSTSLDDIDPFDLSIIKSYAVLEYELEYAEQAQKSCKSTDVRDALHMRIAIIKTNIQVIESQYENGTMDPQEYVSKVGESIKSDTKLAIRLRDTGRKNEAIRVLKRVKIMKQELIDLKEKGMI